MGYRVTGKIFDMTFHAADKPDKLKLSIIVATYNRGEQLLRTLKSLTQQSLDKDLWEAVIVNNNSSDNTAGLFDNFKSSDPDAWNIRMVSEKEQGLSHARNKGMASSRGEYIVIIDDDQLVTADFAKDYLEFFERHPDAAAAGGKITPLYDSEPPRWLSHFTEKPIAGTFDMGKEIKLFKRDKYPFGGNMALRRSTVDKYGGFDPNLGRTGTKLLAGEEKDLFRRLKEGGEKIYWVPGPEIYHIIPGERLTREYFTRLTRMIGVTERIRTKGESTWSYCKRIFSEIIKWGGTAVYGFIYLLALRPSRAGYLFLMRWNITRGLLNI